MLAHTAMPVEHLDLILRGATLGSLALSVAILLRDARHQASGMLAVALAVSVAAYTLVLRPALSLPAIALWPLLILSHGTAVVFWLFVRTLFDDEFRPGWRHLGGWIVWVAIWIAAGRVAAGTLVWEQFPQQVVRLAGILLVMHALWLTRKGGFVDLVESRRRLRRPIVWITGLYIVAVLVLEIVLFHVGLPPDVVRWVRPINVIGMLAVSLAFGWLVFALSDRGLFGPGKTPATPAVVQPADQHNGLATTPDESEAARLSPADLVLVRSLQATMERDRLYRESGLTIAVLALRLGVPEHRLRRIINGGLGHRNFNTFLNGYRLSDVRLALADPAQAAVPIVTVALDAGFQSLGPFNRAFKADTGMTPTEYRRRHGVP